MDYYKITCRFVVARLVVTLSLLGTGSLASAQYEHLFSSPASTPSLVAPAQQLSVAPPTLAPPVTYPSTPYVASITPIEQIPLATPVETLPTPASETAPAIEASIAETVVDSMVDTSNVLTDEIIIDESEVITHWYYPSYWFGPTPWDSGFELGLNGSAGTSESLSFRTGGFIKRKGKDFKLDFSLYYNKTDADGTTTQSNALLDARYDWLFEDSRWSLFVMSQTFYDEFQAFDLNVNVNTGIGYQWIDRETLKLSTTFGSGASREFGGVDEAWVPEANFGLNVEKKLSESKKLYAKMDYFPEWEDFSRYRVLTDIGLEIELNQPSNLSLKLAATDRYDSEPDGVDPHNLNYSALLILKL